MFEGMFDSLFKLIKWGGILLVILVLVIIGLVLYIIFGKLLPVFPAPFFLAAFAHVLAPPRP